MLCAVKKKKKSPKKGKITKTTATKSNSVTASPAIGMEVNY